MEFNIFIWICVTLETIGFVLANSLQHFINQEYADTHFTYRFYTLVLQVLKPPWVPLSFAFHFPYLQTNYFVFNRKWKIYKLYQLYFDRFHQVWIQVKCIIYVKKCIMYNQGCDEYNPPFNTTLIMPAPGPSTRKTGFLLVFWFLPKLPSKTPWHRRFENTFNLSTF